MCLHGLRLVRKRRDSRSDTANFVNPWRPNAYVRRRGKIEKVAVLFLLVITPARASDFPQFDLKATCLDAPRLLAQDADPYERCMTAWLQRRWTSFDSKERHLCISAARVGGGAPSYVEVLCCLELLVAPLHLVPCGHSL